MFTLKPKICAMCGKEYMPISPHQRYCKNPHYRTCPVCGKQYIENNYDKFKYPPTTCSMECRVKKREQTSIEKYGIKAPGNNPVAREKSRQTKRTKYGADYGWDSPLIMEKYKNTLMQKYGVDNPQKNKEIKKKTELTNIERYGSKSYLNSKEGKEKIDNIMLEKYGSTIPLRNDEIKSRWISTNLEKYGEEYTFESDKIKEKIKETSLQKYGTEHPMQSDVVKQHVKDTFIKNYGVDNCFKSKEIIEKIKTNFYKKYGVHSVMEVDDIANKIRATNMKKYGVPYYVMLPNVAKASGRISKTNLHFLDLLKKRGIYGELEYTIENYSYDIYIPQGNIVIEINPSYTHNTIGNRWNPKGIDINYHLKKSIVAEQHGYRCIHLWDWDCPSKFINLLTNRNTIYTKTSTEIIDNDEAKDFIKQYGLYDVTDNIYNMLFLGIRYKSKLMLLMGFKCIDFITNTWSLICIEQRFNYSVYNGNKILLDHFIHLCSPRRIITYSDYSKSNGEICENLGFEYKSFMLPNKIWSKGRHAIIDDKNIINDAMIDDNWLPVYNCGYKIYEKVLD